MKKMKLFEFPFLIFITWYFMPIANGIFPNETWKIPFFCCYAGSMFLLILFANPKNKQNQTLDKRCEFNIIIPIICYMIVFVCFWLMDWQDSREHIRVSFTFWGIYLFYYLSGTQVESRNRIAKWLIFMYVITYITTLIGLITDTSAVRALSHAATADEIRTEYLLRNISGIMLVQTSVFIVPFAFYLAVYKKDVKKKARICSIIFLFVELYFLVSASLSIALLLYFAAIILSILFCSKDVLLKCIVLIVFILCIMFVNFESVFLYLSDNIGNEYIEDRFRSLAAMFAGEGAEGDVALRLDLYTSSLETFWKNPFGVGPNYSYEMFDEGIGHHSQLFDDLARYGIFGLIFYITYLRAFYKLLKKKYQRIGLETIVLPTIILYISMLIFNLAFRTATEAIFVLYLLPAFADILYYKKQ